MWRNPIRPLIKPLITSAELASAIDVASITRLTLVGLVQLVSLPPEIVTLSSLNDLEIVACDNLVSLANVQLPSSPKSLEIKECGVLESLPEGMRFLMHLRKLGLYGNECLRWVPGNSLPTSLHDLYVFNCERWEFPIPKEMMQHYTSLKSIKIFHAGYHLVSFPLGIFPNLCSIWFVMCKGLEKVYIPEGIDDNRLVSLSELRVGACPRLEIIGKDAGGGGATVLPAPNLMFFDTNSCEKLNPVLIEMEGEVLLPKIKQLTIEKPLRSLWRSLFRFSCLTAVLVSDTEMECFPNPDGGWGPLPTSLRYLEIMECPKLQRVDGKALQMLSFLQELRILSCLQLESLPEEGLPLSLGHLLISKCPMVEERCQPEEGLDWPMIQPIPCITINGCCITGP